MRVILCATVLLLLAGCTSPPVASPAPPPPPPVEPPASILVGTIEPADFAPATFALLGPAATGSAGYSIGEPSIRASSNGTLFVAFPGCDNDVSLLSPVDVPGQKVCQNGPVYKSLDEGTTWIYLNDPATGRLTEDGPAANGDNEVAVDMAGTVYASNLGGGLPTVRSDDGGATWTFIGDPVPEDEFADRQWMAAANPGNLVMAWMGSLGSASRSVILNTTFDGGASWTGAVALGDNIGWLGPVNFAPNGKDVYIVWTQPDGGDTPAALSPCSVMVGHSANGGRDWTEIDTGAKIVRNVQGDHWSCVNMAPALDVTGDGSVVAAWSEDINSPGAVTAQGAVVKAVVGTPGGANWTAPFAISTEATAIMPWVAGGAGDRFAVTYFSNIVPLDPDYAGGSWDLQAVFVDNATAGARFARTTIDTAVHEGGICSRGGACLITASDRFLLDFFQNDLMPDGRLVVVYPANPAQGAREVEIRVALQNGGTPLLERLPA